jgi:predicted DsbA family dithiol-disulfide isomerase
MGITIPVAHDFICPWCWVGLLQAKKLNKEFGVNFEWLGYELFPVELEWGYHKPEIIPPNKPPLLSRFDFILVADGVELPKSVRPKQMRTFNAHEAVEYAKTEGVHEELVEALYRAYWERGENINEVETIRQVATGIVSDLDALVHAVTTQQFKANITGFDDEAYSKGVYNVPTFTIGGDRYAEQPYVNLRKALAAAL